MFLTGGTLLVRTKLLDKKTRRLLGWNKGSAGWDLPLAVTWSCTKSLWFLRPTDDYYPLKAWREEPGSSTREARVSNLGCGQASLGGQGEFNPYFQNHNLAFFLNYVYI